MRPKALLAAAFALALAAAGPVPRNILDAAAAAADSPRDPGAPRETLLVVPTGEKREAPDSAASDSSAARAMEAARGDTARADTSGLFVRADAARKEGMTSFVELIRARRPAIVGLAPSFGPLDATIQLPDAGSPIRPWPRAIAADRATDRTVLAGLGGIDFPIGVPEFATTWDAPGAEGAEPFDYVALDPSLAPGPLRAAGELLARPRVVLFSAYALPGKPHASRRVRSALYYRKGEGSATDTGARFASPLLARGVAASFSRHATDALDPFLRSLSTHYYAAAGLPALGSVDAWAEGRLFEKVTEIDFPGGYGEETFTTTRARAEWAAREASIHARSSSDGLEASGALRIGQGKATDVSYLNKRERWTYPEVGAEAGLSATLRDAWTWSLGAEGSRRRVEFRGVQDTEFTRRVFSGRAMTGLRRALGPSAGVAADAAADLREGDPTLFDARLSLWSAGPRGRLRLDLESAHERPTWVDLLSPARADTAFLFPRVLVYRRAGDPSLRARALRGALAAGSAALGPSVELFGFGSARRVTDDFGWDAVSIETTDTLRVVNVARVRGDGWAFHAAAGFSGRKGPFIGRGLAWIREGTEGLSPRSGSPASRGLDAGLGIRAALFRGDLPLEVGAEAHALGPRRGLIRAPGIVSWDGYLRADFSSAGLFAQFTNVFDRAIPSAIYAIDTGRAAPLPPRTFHFGVVWYLLD